MSRALSQPPANELPPKGWSESDQERRTILRFRGASQIAPRAESSIRSGLVAAGSGTRSRPRHPAEATNGGRPGRRGPDSALQPWNRSPPVPTVSTPLRTSPNSPGGQRRSAPRPDIIRLTAEFAAASNQRVSKLWLAMDVQEIFSAVDVVIQRHGLHAERGAEPPPRELPQIGLIDQGHRTISVEASGPRGSVWLLFG